MALLLAIAFLDLVATAFFYSRGWIEELNPLMRPLLESNVWWFVLAKGATIALAWAVFLRHWDRHRAFIETACRIGAATYVLVWTTWFLAASLA